MDDYSYQRRNIQLKQIRESGKCIIIEDKSEKNAMLVFVIIIASLAVIGLILYFGEFRFEMKMEKNATDSDAINKSALDCLSHTELNILKQLAEGKTNQEIADNQFISVHTVKKHISNIFKKLNIQSRNETRKFKELINNNI